MTQREELDRDCPQTHADELRSLDAKRRMSAIVPDHKNAHCVADHPKQEMVWKSSEIHAAQFAANPVKALRPLARLFDSDQQLVEELISGGAVESIQRALFGVRQRATTSRTACALNRTLSASGMFFSHGIHPRWACLS